MSPSGGIKDIHEAGAVYTYMYVYICICVYIFLCIYVHLCVYLCVYICVYICLEYSIPISTSQELVVCKVAAGIFKNILIITLGNGNILSIRK